MKDELTIEDLKVLMGNTKIKLDCGHEATPGHNLADTIIIVSLGGDRIETRCGECGY